MACDNCSTTLEEVEQGHCRHCSQAWHRKPYDAAVAVLAKAAAAGIIPGDSPQG
jgi:hypothetical protein